MGLFDFMKTKTSGANHGFTDVIENEDTTGLFLWKSPIVDFNNNSTLIVKQGETALFVKNGKIEGIYVNNGLDTDNAVQTDRIKLDTKNFPFLRNLTEKFTGGTSCYKCSIYFIRTNVTSNEIKWGMTPLQVHDKITSYDMMMTSFGAYTYKVVDPVAFFKQAKGAPIVSDKDVLKVIGTKAQNKISGILTYFVTEAGYPFDAISQNIMMSDFENSFLEALNTVPILKDYGIEVNSFSIGGINFTEDGLNKTLSMRTSSKALNEEIGILGQCNWNSIHNREILMAAANNKGVMGGMVNMGLGGMMVGNMLDMMHPDKVNQMPVPGVDRAAGSFDSDASIKEAAKVREKIGALKSDYEAGFIPEEVYDQKLKELQQRLANLY